MKEGALCVRRCCCFFIAIKMRDVAVGAERAPLLRVGVLKRVSDVLNVRSHREFHTIHYLAAQQ